MIRAKKLFAEFKDKINQSVDLGNRLENLLHPFDKILYTLFDSNEKIHNLGQTLDPNKSYQTEEVENANNILLPAEKAAALLEVKEYSDWRYRKVAAKAVNAGDKLDTIVTHTIKDTEKEFKRNYRALKRGKRATLTTLEEKRITLYAITEAYQTLENIHTARGLPQTSISTVKTTFDEYKAKLDQIAEIERDIQELVSEYENTPVCELKQFIKHARTQISKSSFFSKEENLSERCSQVDYVEGNVKLEEIEKGLAYIQKNYNQIRALGDETTLSSFNPTDIKTMLDTNDLEKKLTEVTSNQSPSQPSAQAATTTQEEDVYKTYVEACPIAVTFGSKEGDRCQTSLRALIHTIGFPHTPKSQKLRKIVYSDNGYSMDTFQELNTFLDTLNQKSKYASDPKELGYFESIYQGVKDSLRQGSMARLRKKQNEGTISSVLANFENYVVQSRATLA